MVIPHGGWIIFVGGLRGDSGCHGDCPLPPSQQNMVSVTKWMACGLSTVILPTHRVGRIRAPTGRTAHAHPNILYIHPKPKPNQTMVETTNSQQPPSSAEEAAALLGAAISFAAADPHMASGNNDAGGHHANPPAGMHSIFAVQSPVPNVALFVQLCNLREWLRWHTMDEYSADGVQDVSSL